MQQAEVDGVAGEDIFLPPRKRLAEGAVAMARGGDKLLNC